MSALGFAARFLLLFLLPGYLATLVCLRSHLRRGRIPLGPGLFGCCALSLLLTTSAAHALGSVGLFSTSRFALWMGLFCAPLAVAVLVRRIPLWPFSLEGGATRHLAPAPLLLLLAFVYLPPSERILTDGDHAVYANTGLHIAREGSIWFENDLLARVPEIRPLSWGQYLRGFYFPDQESRNLIAPHGFHFLSAYLAALHVCGGQSALLSGPAILALLSLWSLYLLAGRFGGPLAGIAVALLVGFNVDMVWFARITYAEVLAQTLLLASSALLALALPRGGEAEPPRPLSASQLLLSGALLGALYLTKIDFLPAIGVVPFFCGLLWVLGRWNRRTALFPVGYVIYLGLAVQYALGTHVVYAAAQFRTWNRWFQGSVPWLLLGALLGPALLFFVFRHALRRALLRLPALRLLAAAGAVVLCLGAYGYFLLPARAEWGTRPAAELGWIQGVLGLAPDMVRDPSNERGALLRTWREYAVRDLALYVTGPGFFLGLLGVFLLLRRRDHLGLVPFLLLVLLQTMMTLWVGGVLPAAPAHPDLGRRYLTVSMPGLVLGAVLPWFSFPRRSVLAPAVGVAIAVFLAWRFLLVSAPHLGYHALPDRRAVIRDLAHGVPREVLWIGFPQDEIACRYLGPLRFFERQPVLILSEHIPPEAIPILLLRLQAAGYVPILLSGRESDAAGTPAEIACRQTLQSRGVRVYDVVEPTVLEQRWRIPELRDLHLWQHRLFISGSP